jgi:hypothetical protein
MILALHEGNELMVWCFSLADCAHNKKARNACQQALGKAEGQILKPEAERRTLCNGWTNLPRPGNDE